MFAVSCEHLREAVHEIILQFARDGHSFSVHQPPAVGTALPLREINLVTADMDVFRRKEFADFAQNVGQQCVVFLASHAPSRTVIVSVGRNRVGRIVATDFRMNGCDVAAVAGQIDFGDDFYIAYGCVIDQFTYLRLREITAVFFVPFAVDGSYGRVAAPESADFGQFGVRFDFDAPALVVGQVEVQFVDAVVGQQVDEPSDCIGTLPCAGDVEHHSPIGKPRSVGQYRVSQFDAFRTLFCIDFGRHQPEQGLYPVEDTAVVGPCDVDA